MRISDWSSAVCSSDLPFVARAYADSAYNSDRVRDATSITIEIVRKFADQTGFVVHPRRWIVARTFAWINSNRRLDKDFERTIKSATALLYAAAAIVLTRRIARSPLDSRHTLNTITLLDDVDRKCHR